jgi:nucleoside-diphosphate-sugar epimerase
MTSLVTGASGFIGSHLVDYLLARGDEVVVLQRTEIAWPHPRVHARRGDILDGDFVASTIREYSPAEIYHLSAQSLPSVSWQHPHRTVEVNVCGTINVLEAARLAKLSSAIVVASSSAIYADSDTGLPITEENACDPSTPYGISKLAADDFARLYAARYAMRVMRARPFFLIGAGKTGDVCSDWSRNIVALERGEEAALRVGNVEFVRDFLHVVDGVEALAIIAARGSAGTAYNVSSGSGWHGKALLETLTSFAHAPVSVTVEPSKVRPLDERVKVGANDRLKGLGWLPRRSVEQALRETVEYWRAQGCRPSS